MNSPSSLKQDLAFSPTLQKVRGAARLPSAGRHWSCPQFWLLLVLLLEQTLQEIELQHLGEENGTALNHQPPVDVVGLQEEGVGCFLHLGEVVEPPHVEDVELQLLGADLWERQALSSGAAAESWAGKVALGAAHWA